MSFGQCPFKYTDTENGCSKACALFIKRDDKQSICSFKAIALKLLQPQNEQK
jgi:hypothetical protein